MSTYSFYRVEKKGHVASVFLNRPEKKNAMGPAAWTEPVDIFADLDADPEVRVVILSGEGVCFSAGIDLVGMIPQLPELMEGKQFGGTKWQLLPKIQLLQKGISAIENCRKPVIAAIHGHCLGAGLDMVSACDIRLCSEDAIFSIKEAAVGFVADVGVLQRIPRIIGEGNARELAFTAKNIGSVRAKEIQLVSAVYSDHEALMQEAKLLAGEIAANSPLAVQASKDVMNYCASKSVEDGLRYVASISANIIPSEDLLEAMQAFQQKRKPVFTGK
ncbi:crotonase/enoyl-CoA hydratase family protein [Desulforhopalus sp. IMCC35007]|uniref:crotonase/enoyl-CoA hydratase family protein n=1 Tax=Desulforhopalus sp. IMCC35007 TaxID=2569543 RepID=UPI0010AEC922|nr:crotonase/enoyl-CoA hydratase family protein [Desulforhopalus sp. IMCC35007]TKB05793.1 crotonase/enoyl-CoA hydratase family protein [Desulforhopalus sp. IMCC35007]